MATQRAFDAMAAPHSPATSQILTERLQARRMDSRKTRRRTDFGPIRPAGDDDDIFMAEAEASSVLGDHSFASSRRSHAGTTRPTANTVTKTRAPGLKEMDDKLQRLEKQNFDLKMEVFHRREREEKLHDQLRKMHDQVLLAQKIQKEHATLLELNGELVEELDKANEAVDQAVQMICDLENKVEMLETKSRLPSSHSDSGYGDSTAATTVTPPTPPPHQRLGPESSPVVRSRPKVANQSDRPHKRVPSFMSDTGSNTLALREAYIGTTRNLRQAMSFVSILSDETAKETINELNSPRLSLLSENSFPSGYDLNSTELEATNDAPVSTKGDSFIDERPSRNYREDSVKKVSKWVQQGGGEIATQPRFLAGSSTFQEDSTDESRRTSAASSDVESGFVGYPDGASIIRGTPSRFKEQSGVPQPITAAHGQTTPQQNYHRRKSSAEVYLHNSVNERPQYARAETSPIVEDSQEADRQDWPLTDQPRQDSVQYDRGTTPTKSHATRRNSTRASLAARTQRFWGRLSTGARDSTSPPPKPRIENRRPLTKSMTAADISHQPLETSEQFPGQMSPGFVGMHYANPTKASSRRRSADVGGQRQRVPTMSKNGAQAAWESKAVRTERQEGRERERTWRA
ncbi:hypothetical protein BDZ85DRAFT_266011 [Elsinoe ampelina]|uniref:Centrosomin N-terminal motif 1 domain-containing protein n=1 Tax=Elsinoe ampelina TaxID=302913 RepID=A0A6A6G693_9PEZI|nr:hypothetical protein BDZ85DRAFT_266011 [Elsinoe ampelina]